MKKIKVTKNSNVGWFKGWVHGVPFYAADEKNAGTFSRNDAQKIAAQLRTADPSSIVEVIEVVPA